MSSVPGIKEKENKEFTRDPIVFFLREDTELVEYIERIIPTYSDKFQEAYKRRRQEDRTATMTENEFVESFGLFMVEVRKCKTIRENRVPYDVAKKMARRLYAWFFHRYLDGETHVRLARKVPKQYRVKTYPLIKTPN